MQNNVALEAWLFRHRPEMARPALGAISGAARQDTWRRLRGETDGRPVARQTSAVGGKARHRRRSVPGGVGIPIGLNWSGWRESNPRLQFGNRCSTFELHPRDES